jgi:hypothetical protein
MDPNPNIRISESIWYQQVLGGSLFSKKELVGKGR